VIITVALTLLFLLGFMAIALDFGHLFIVKTELQTATDSCALAAAQELDGATDALTRATNAGRTAGNLNKVNFQGSSAGIADADITFSDSLIGAYSHTFTPVASAKYAKCNHTKSGMKPWLLQAMGAFTGNAAYGADQGVFALAVATRASAQTTCPVPVAIKPKSGSTAPNYGFQVGEWVTLLGKGVAGNGEMGWYNLDGSKNASETEKELSEPGYCGTRVNDTLGTPGVQSSVAEVWNYRFGIYKDKTPNPDVNHPDYTGYAYTSQNWKNTVPKPAFSGTPAAGSHASAANFLAKRLAFASYDDTGTDLSNGNKITGLKTSSFKSLATPGTGNQHNLYGYSRRLVAAPVINDANQVIDFACMLMLQPMSIPPDDVQLEFRGNAGAMSSPCTTNGLAGGAAGPLVPVLVQ
jgi:hypothetical protein